MKAYHSTSCDITPGTQFIGYDREKLSELLGGNVGFAYLNLPPEWKDSDSVWEIELPDNCPVALSLNGETIPRRDYTGLTFEEAMSGVPIWFGREKIVYEGFIGEASELSQFHDSKVGELAFLASGVIFIKKINS